MSWTLDSEPESKDDSPVGTDMKSALENYWKAKALADKSADSTDEGDGAYKHKWDAAHAIYETPAYSAADLKAKIEVFEREDMHTVYDTGERWLVTFLEELLTDCRRLGLCPLEREPLDLRKSDLDYLIEEVRDVRHTIVALAGSDGLEDWMVGTLSTMQNALERAVDAMRFILFKEGPDYGHKLPRCSVPQCDGIVPVTIDKEALWDRYFTAAPRPLTPCERQYSDRKLRSRN